jgi:hypothetical protein|tara:strand:+ start:136 stop:429 length:294 start_codon:yes stop_codon:yes gene_type:complete
MVHPSFEWAEVLWTSDDGLLHVAVFDSDDPGNTLALFDKAGATMETAMRHTALLTTVEDDGNAVAFLVLVHHTADVQAAAFILSSSQNATSSNSLTL